MQLELTIPDVLGKVIQDSRKAQHITAEQMLDVMGGASQHHFYNIENGRAKPGYKALIAIVRFLHIDPNLFFYPERRDLDAKRLRLIHAIETCSNERLDVLDAILSGMPAEVDTKNTK